ncbi:MAG: hydroxylase [Coleofasciculaceae cyanobacterium RL_1_1]|nr:hydroxylase [Coleofasciculaceae cyanobacterium RL_1_1]
MPEKLDATVVDIKPTLSKLLEQSAKTLETILQDDSVAATERADIALRILALAGGLDVPVIPELADTARPIAATQAAIATPTSNPSPMPALQHAQPAASPDPYATFPEFLPGDYLQIDDFLSPEENQQILQIAIDRQSDFVPTSTSTNADNYRASYVLYPSFFTDFYYLVSSRLRAMQSEVVQALNLPEFSIDELEMQLTAHGDGNFYKVHNDADGEVIKRTLTYVYYFNREPKPFRGGNLRMYETNYVNGWVAKPEYQDIEPINNRIVLFDSRCMHEVLPIKSDSDVFADSRFTLNGWLRRP